MALHKVLGKEDKDAKPLASVEDKAKSTGAILADDCLKDYFDDSSDEELVEGRLAKYSLEDKWQHCYSQHSYLDEEKVKSLRYSFVAHAVGLRYLYSREVNQHYYRTIRRKELVSQTVPKDRVQELIQTGLMSCVDNIVETQASLHLRKSMGNSQTPLSAEEVSGLADELKTTLRESIASYCNSFRAQRLFLQHQRNAIYKQDVLNSLNEIKKEIITQFVSLVKKHNLSFRPAVAEPNFTHWHNSLVVPLSMNGMVVNEAKTCLHQLGYLPDTKEVYFSFGKEERVKWKTWAETNPQEFKKLQYPRLGQAAFDAALSAANSKTHVDTALRQRIQTLARSLIRDWLVLDAKETSVTSSVWQHTSRFPALRQLLNMSIGRFECDILHMTEKSFDSWLDDCRKQVSPEITCLRRSTLDDLHHFHQDNILELLAHVRLSNRSQKRNIRNLYYSLFVTKLGAGIKSSKSPDKKGGGKMYVTTVARSWSFFSMKQTQAIETQSIVCGSYGREDYINNLGIGLGGSYKDVIKNINTLTELFVKYMPEKDLKVVVGQWLRSILLGKSAEVLADVRAMKPYGEDERYICQLLSSITYLLFGCEVARNPSSIVLNQMMLDLVIHASLNWEAAIQAMPMSSSEIVSTARSLHEKFNGYMPAHYRYEGTAEGDASLLVEREADLMKYWLRYIKIRDGEKMGLPDNSNAEGWISQLATLIERESIRWFGERFTPYFSAQREMSDWQAPMKSMRG